MNDSKMHYAFAQEISPSLHLVKHTRESNTFYWVISEIGGNLMKGQLSK